MPRKPGPGAAEWIDPDDAPELTDAWFDDAVWEVNGVRIPTPPRRDLRVDRVEMTLHMDADIAAFFRTSEPGWEQRINAALRGLLHRG